MKKPKLFLTLVLILLVINTIFYLLWYAFDLQGTVRKLVEKGVGKAINGQLHIGSFTISDRQIFAKNIQFQGDDRKLSFKVASLRVRYNLLQIIISGFKVGTGISTIDISSPEVTYNLTPSLKKTAKKPLVIPDLSHYFEKITVSNGKFDFNGFIQTGKNPTDILELHESLNNTSITASNTRKTTVNLRANVRDKGSLKGMLILDRGNIAFVEADLADYSPQQIKHPLIKYNSTELSAHISMNHLKKDDPITLDYKAFLWNTDVLVKNYSLKIPYLGISGNQDKISVDLANSSVDASNLEGSVYITELQHIPQVEAYINIKKLYPSIADKRISGFLSGEIRASGRLLNPLVTANLTSQDLTYSNYTLNDLSLEAKYYDQQITYNLAKAVWNNQIVSTTGSFDFHTNHLVGDLVCFPIDLEKRDLNINTNLAYNVYFCPGYPDVTLDVQHLSISHKSLNSGNITGTVQLLPSVLPSNQSSYLANLNLSSDKGWKIDALGDIPNKTATLQIDLDSLLVASIINDKTTIQYDPSVSGRLDLIYDHDTLTGRTDLVVDANKTFPLKLILQSLYNYNIASKSGAISLYSNNSQLNNTPFDLGLDAQLSNNVVSVSKLYLNDNIKLNGSMNTQNIHDFCFDLGLSHINTAFFDNYLGFLKVKLPQFESLDLAATYNLKGNDEIAANASVTNFQQYPLQPLSANVQISGDSHQLELSGEVSAPTITLAQLSGSANILPKLNIFLTAVTDSLHIPEALSINDFSGYLHGETTMSLKNLLKPKPQITMSAKYSGQNLSYQDTSIDTLAIDIEQQNSLFKVNKLIAKAKGLVSMNASGALDYNLFSNTYFEGTNKLNVSLDVSLFKWLEKQFGAIQEANGKTTLDCSIGVTDEQFIVSTGKLRVTNGSLKIANQMEDITDITIDADIVDNRLQINEANCSIGQGKLFIENYFEQDIGDNFFVGFLDLGMFRIRSDNNGFLVNVPLYSPPRNLTKVIIKGRDSRFAIVKGPFDDMKIVADVLASSTNALYPSNTDNLLKLINTVRSATAPKTKHDPIPLPFKLDLMLILKDNVRYVTYPASIEVLPNSYLHLVYDGQIWSVPEAYFGSESGSIDFIGSVFTVDFVSVNIIESQNLISVDGTFIKRASDGSIITLTVSTNRDYSKDFFNRLEFNLSSDNPQDRTIQQVISRLRYNQSYEDLSPGQRQDLLQDEALNLISSNLNTSFITPFLYPIENRIRQALHLDSFTINVGFIQNLFTQYTSNSSRFANYTDFKQIDSDVMQFSSSILLNNFSVSTSKYLGRKVFVDYRFGLQEASDLANNTKLLIQHDTSLRVNLPYQFKIAYTFSYEPVDKQITHQVMLQRSFRF